MLAQNELIIERLQDIYDRAIKSDTRRDFFIPLFEYITVYDEEPVLEKAIKSIVKNGRREIKKQGILADKALVEIRKVYKEVKKYIEKEKVTNQATIDNLNQFTAYGELLRTSMRKNEKSIGQNRKKLPRKLANCLKVLKSTKNGYF